MTFSTIKHGEARRSHRTRLYKVWEAMMQRTTNPSSIEYKHYGGRGITVCDEWKTPSAFIEWARNNGYQDNLVIDRIKNDKNYQPDNCRFVTYGISNFNKRKRPDFGIYKRENRYRVSLKKDGKMHYGGCTAHIEVARVMRDDLVNKLYKVN